LRKAKLIRNYLAAVSNQTFGQETADNSERF